tara:strand:- start:134 stop:595 length:462 start_codon:yes stop_codon:yes gene_type:complete
MVEAKRWTVIVSAAGKNAIDAWVKFTPRKQSREVTDALVSFAQQNKGAFAKHLESLPRPLTVVQRRKVVDLLETLGAERLHDVVNEVADAKGVIGPKPIKAPRSYSLPGRPYNEKPAQCPHCSKATVWQKDPDEPGSLSCMFCSRLIKVKDSI